MPEQLLTAADVAKRLAISPSHFGRLRADMIVAGLRVVKIPSRQEGGSPLVRYTASSLERLMDRAAEKEALLC